MREYTGKVDELIKDKIEAQKEEKAKEQEDKEVMSQQVLVKLLQLGFVFGSKTNFIIFCLCYGAEYVCSVTATGFACTTNARNERRLLCTTTGDERRLL